MPKLKRGEMWEVDFNPQSYKEEPAKRGRPALVVQTDFLNGAGHATTIVIPGTTQVYADALGDAFPLRVSLPKGVGLKQATDLLIDQVRAISNQRILGVRPITSLSRNHMKRVEEALHVLTGA